MNGFMFSASDQLQVHNSVVQFDFIPMMYKKPNRDRPIMLHPNDTITAFPTSKNTNYGIALVHIKTSIPTKSNFNRRSSVLSVLSPSIVAITKALGDSLSLASRTDTNQPVGHIFDWPKCLPRPVLSIVCIAQSLRSVFIPTTFEQADSSVLGNRGVAIATPALVVKTAPAACQQGTTASCNGTYFHFNPSMSSISQVGF